MIDGKQMDGWGGGVRWRRQREENRRTSRLDRWWGQEVEGNALCKYLHMLQSTSFSCRSVLYLYMNRNAKSLYKKQDKLLNCGVGREEGEGLRSTADFTAAFHFVETAVRLRLKGRSPLKRVLAWVGRWGGGQVAVRRGEGGEHGVGLVRAGRRSVTAMGGCSFLHEGSKFWRNKKQSRPLSYSPTNRHIHQSRAGGCVFTALWAVQQGLVIG